MSCYQTLSGPVSAIPCTLALSVLDLIEKTIPRLLTVFLIYCSQGHLSCLTCFSQVLASNVYIIFFVFWGNGQHVDYDWLLWRYANPTILSDRLYVLSVWSNCKAYIYYHGLKKFFSRNNIVIVLSSSTIRKLKESSVRCILLCLGLCSCRSVRVPLLNSYITKSVFMWMLLFWCISPT